MKLTVILNKIQSVDVMLLLFPCFQFGNGMSKKQLATYSKYGDRGALFDSIEVVHLYSCSKFSIVFK